VSSVMIVGSRSWPLSFPLRVVSRWGSLCHSPRSAPTRMLWLCLCSRPSTSRVHRDSVGATINFVRMRMRFPNMI